MFPTCSCRFVLWVGLLWLLAPGIFAAGTNDEWLARSWQTEDGLPDNSVTGVAQTEDGYLWVGTPSGLARFDGLQFDFISLTNIIPEPNSGIITMLRGRHKALWLAMDRGAVVRLSGETSRAFVQDLPNFIPNGLAEDAAGDLWISYRGGTVYRVQEGQAVQVATEQGLPAGSDICALTTDRDGCLWFAKAGQVGVCSNGLFRVLQHLDAQPMRLAAARDGGVWVCCGFHLYRCDGQGAVQDFGEFHPEISGTVATVMLEDHAGTVWIGTAFSGLYRHDQSGFQAMPTSHDEVLSLLEDRDGNVWAGTRGAGLNRIRRRAISLEDASDGLPYPSVQSICEAADGTIWAATQNRVLARRVAGRWQTIPASADWPGDATCVSADTLGTVWVGTSTNGLYCWREGKFVDWAGAAALRGQTLHTLLTTTNGDLWIGRESPNGVLRLRGGRLTTFPVSPANRVIRAMVEDAAGTIWAGTSRGNLLRINGEQISDATPRPEARLAPIRCLCATPDGALWIGYARWGVGCLRGGRYVEYNSAQGLYSDSVSHIVADRHGWLWFGSNKGIFKAREQDFVDAAAGSNARVRSIHYGRSDGLPSLQGTFGESPNALGSRDGRLWIPMQTGLVLADPAKLEEKTEPPPTMLTRVLVDQRVVAEYAGILPRRCRPAEQTLQLNTDLSGLKLGPAYNRITFEFAAFDFTAPENVQFRHRLAGLEDGWEESGVVRASTYPRLPNGHYDFQVEACSPDGDWSQTPSRLGLTVAPFLYQRWWFRLAAVAAFTGCIIAIVRYVSFRRLRARLRVLEQQAALQRERTRIAKDIHDDLGANLTQIAYLGELANQDRGAPDLVGERIRIISTTARQAVKALDEIVWAVNPRNDTLAHLLDYAGQFAVDYLRLLNIRCRLDFPAEVPPRELSTDLRHNLFLVIKEALHNIFKHARATEVWLRAAVDEQALEVIIEDNGCGFTCAPDDALADGLRNMRQRMTEIGGGFEVASQAGSGTKIKLRLPWPKPL